MLLLMRYLNVGSFPLFVFGRSYFVSDKVIKKAVFCHRIKKNIKK